VSGALGRIGALFVEPGRRFTAGGSEHLGAAGGSGRRVAGGGPGHRVVARESVRPSGGVPTVVVLCSATRARAAAAGLALALSGDCGSACALAGVVGDATALPTAVPLLASRRAAARLHERRVAASASGRLVWLGAGRNGGTEEDPSAFAAAASAELGRAVGLVGAPAVLSIPFARTEALDRVLAWHAGTVVVPEPGADGALVARALASLGELDRPVVAMAPPARWAAALAVAGLCAPRCATDAVAQLDLAGVRRDA
jgi:hypothetical protein